MNSKSIISSLLVVVVVALVVLTGGCTRPAPGVFAVVSVDTDLCVVKTYDCADGHEVIFSADDDLCEKLRGEQNIQDLYLDVNQCGEVRPRHFCPSICVKPTRK